jgi:hypothetical protein
MQKISSISYQLIVFHLSFLILLTGCHSYFTIPKENYDKISTMEEIKIIYDNGKEFVVENNDTTNAKIVGDSLVIYKGAENDIISMNKIEKIKENRFDLGGTITVIIIPLIILVAYFFANFSFH